MTQEQIWYFSYGSNLSKQQMLRRTGSIPEARTAFLSDHRLAFRKVREGHDVYATIVPKDGATVFGVAYLCSPYAIAQLDVFEGVAEHCYRREMIEVTTGLGENLSCVVYIGESFVIEDAVPSPEYWNLIQSGAIEHQLPSDYIDSIAALARGKV